jgi:ElaB/YqjD/DUF883 family membrane-anchored ribosome-binding protein
VITDAQAVANEAIDSLANSVIEMREHAAPMVSRITQAADRTSAVARQTADSIRGSAWHASEATVGYIKHEPVKAMLLAASLGAALMALISLVGPSRRHH